MEKPVVKFSEMTRNDIVDVALDTDNRVDTPNIIFRGTFVKFIPNGLAFVILDNGGWGYFSEKQTTVIQHNEDTELSSKLKMSVQLLLSTITGLIEVFESTHDLKG